MITANYSDYADGGSHKEFEISVVGTETTYDNSQMLSESIKLDEALCSEQNLRFGSCEASQFSVQIANSEISLEGKTLEVSVTMDEDTTKYGTFKVISDKPTADRIWRVITAYDKMYDIINADVLTWYNGLTFPMTLANFRNSFFNHLGISQVSTNLVNDSFSIPGGFSSTGSLSGKTIITAICEFNGVFGHINRDGNFEYISLDNADSFNCPPYENNSVTYQDYVTSAITKVTMRGSASDVGTSVGVDGNEYIITNNPLIYGTEGSQALITALTNLLNKISLVTFRPFQLNKTIGNPCVELGDAIVITTKYQTINSYVLKRVLSGIQALRDNYSATGNKYYPKEVNSVQEQISRTQGKMNELERTVDGTVSTVTSLSQNAITTDTLHYLATSLDSGVTTSTAGWTTTPQSMTPTNKYLWTYHTYTYADAHTSDTTPVITGVYGEDGQQGQTGPQGPAGPTGADGLSITEVTSIYYASDSNTAPSAPLSEVTTTSSSVYNTWTKGIPALTSTYNKLYTCDQVKYSNNTFTWTTPVLNSAITTAVSEIQQLANQIVLKVKSDGTVAKVELGADASTGSNVLIKGDNIQLDGNVTITSGFTLTADNINVSSLSSLSANLGTVTAGVIQSQNYVANTSGMKINLADGSWDGANFKLNASGNVTMNGSITFKDTLYMIETINNIKVPVMTYTASDADGTGTPQIWDFELLSPHGELLIVSKFRVGNQFLGNASSATHATTAGSAQPVFNNNTWYKVGDDVQIGDQNAVGKLFVQGLNGETGIRFKQHNATNTFDISFDGTSIKLGGVWYINTTDIYDASSTTTCGMGKNGTSYAFWAGTSYGNRNNAPFKVGHGGGISACASISCQGDINISNNKSVIVGSNSKYTNLGTNSAVLCADNGTFIRKYSNTNTAMSITASSFINASSRLVKENVKPITEEYAKKILQLEPKSFDYIEKVGGEKDCVGMIAEEVLDIMPNLVIIPEDYNEEETKERLENEEFTQTLSLDYAKFVPPLIKLVQMQQKQIDDLKKLIKTEE